MDAQTKELLHRSLNQFRAAEKKEMVSYVQNNLKRHERLLNQVGEGYADCFVRAGKIFLRIVNTT